MGLRLASGKFDNAPLTRAGLITPRCRGAGARAGCADREDHDKQAWVAC